jgi:uncharacterized protein (DUF1499 family)
VKRLTIPLALALAGLSLVLLVAGPVGSRIGLWEFPFGFQLLRWGAWAGIAAVLVGLIAGFLTRRWLAVAVVVVVALLAAAIPMMWLQRARSVPPIHDITTDTQNPPAFVAIAPLRADAPNPIGYEGEEVASQQRQAYPDVRPLHLEVPPDAAFARVRDAAEAMGWDIVDADTADGRLEASDTTFWFGFTDDIVVRVTAEDAGSRVDVRSKSRVGRSDVGTNARRIRAYLSRLAAD